MHDNVIGESKDAKVPAVKGDYTGTGPEYVHDGGKGVQGHSQNGYGVHGISEVGRGVVAESDTNYGLRATSRTLSAARCSSTEGTGVEGEAGGAGDGVRGTSKTGNGVHGISETGYGVKGESNSGRGVAAFSDTNYGLRATSRTLSAARCSSPEGTGVEGEAGGAGDGVRGTSKTGNGVHGISETAYGLRGESNSGRGVAAFSDTNYGLRAVSRTLAAARCSSTNGNGVEGEARGAGTGIVGTSVTGVGVFGKGGRLAGRFEGDVEVTGDIRLTNADFAEDFNVIEDAEPGEVMVLTATDTLQPCTKAYDKKVVGVISGAGNYKPGIILDKQNDDADRKPIAMMGKVYCRVDADISPIETGDMLTTSALAGYAMKAVDPMKSFGAVIGKALAPLAGGRGLIPILVVLQ